MRGLSPADHETRILGLPVTLYKQPLVDDYGNVLVDAEGEKVYRCGFRVGGGIDQDPTFSPQHYPDTGVYVTYIEEGGAAENCGLKPHDKILQVNGTDFTTVTHEKACHIIRNSSVLNMVVFRTNRDDQDYPIDYSRMSNRDKLQYDFSQ